MSMTLFQISDVLLLEHPSVLCTYVSAQTVRLPTDKSAIGAELAHGAS